MTTNLSKTEAEAPKSPNPLLIFAAPVLETLALLGWWLYATIHTVNFPGNTTYSDGTHDNGNVVMFNVVLMLILALSWIGASVYWCWRDNQ